MMVNLINNRKMTIRFRYILLFAVSLFCLSCSDDDSITSVREYPIEVELGCDMTKVGIDGNDLFWESGDQIAFRATGASGVAAVAVLTLNDVDSGLGRAKFKGSVVMTEMPVKCEFAYPADAFAESGKTVYDYSVQDGTHKPYLYGTDEYSEEGMDCTLGHVGGLIRITVADGVESLSVSSNSGSYVTVTDGSSSYEGQKISKVALGAEGTVAATEDASHLINVSVPPASDVVYAFVPAIEFVEGISIVCNHENGSKMFKSFSATGGNFASYDFEAGSVIDIDLTEFEGFTADCTCAAEHSYDEGGILTGTKVDMTGFTVTGTPAKIIDQWGVAIYDSAGHFIRWTYGEGAYDGTVKEMTDDAGDWPLLKPGEYTLYAICNINGHTLQFTASQKLKVSAPNIVVTPIAETSWSYRGNPTKANACGNNTIERLGVKVNVSDNILNHSNTDYGFKARMQNTTTNADSGELTMNTNFTSTSGLNLSYNAATREYDLKNGDGLYVLQVAEDKWGAQNVLVSVSFAGNTYSNHTTAYVTGLPYRHNFRENHSLDGGVLTGTESWHKHNGLEIRYYYNWVLSTTQYTQVYYSRTFRVPENVNVSFKSEFNAINTGLSPGKYVAYTGLVTSTSSPSTDFMSKELTTDGSSNFDTAANAAAATDHPVEGTGTLSSSSRLSASTNGGNFKAAVENGVYLSYMEILYK